MRRYLMQKKYCEENGLPMFVPMVCLCGNSPMDGVSDDIASTTLITGCPFCHRTFTD